MGVVATLLPNTTHVQRVRAALKERYDVIVCGDWVSLVRVCEQQTVDIAFVDPFSMPQDGVGQRIRQLKQRIPRLTLIVYGDFAAEHADVLFEAGRQGADGLIVANRGDESTAFLALIDRAESQSLGAQVQQALAGIETVARDAILLAVTHARDGLSNDDLAARLGLHRRTLSAHLARAGLPSTQRLLNWGRLIVAAHALEDKHRSAQRVAASLGYPSGSAFRNTCQRYLHATPQEIRARGGGAYALRAMLKQLQPNMARDNAQAPAHARRARHLTVAI